MLLTFIFNKTETGLSHVVGSRIQRMLHPLSLAVSNNPSRPTKTGIRDVKCGAKLVARLSCGIHIRPLQTANILLGS